MKETEYREAGACLWKGVRLLFRSVYLTIATHKVLTVCLVSLLANVVLMLSYADSCSQREILKRDCFLMEQKCDSLKQIAR